MLEFLQTGKALSVLATIGLIGLVSKLITRSLYRRLLKDTENMAMTKNKNLKALKQKLENAYRLGQNIYNTQAYLDKLMYGFRFCHLSLDTWNNLSYQMMILGLLFGGMGSFLSYWFRLDAYYIVLYASAATLGALFLAFLDTSFQIGQKQQKLETVLLEYMDNSVFVRATREAAARETVARETVARESTARDVMGREPLVRDGAVRESAIRDLAARDSGLRLSENREISRREKGRNSKAEELLRTVRSMKGEENQSSEEFTRATGNRQESSEPITGSQARRDIDYLKKSLAQIAASRERDPGNGAREEPKPKAGDWTKDLTSEEVRLIGEIMRDYFSTT